MVAQGVFVAAEYQTHAFEICVVFLFLGAEAPTWLGCFSNYLDAFFTQLAGSVLASSFIFF